MAYLHKVIDHDIETVACAEPPEGPGFDAETVKKADRMEVWATTATDTGEDWTEFRLFSGEQLIAKQRIAGY